MPIIENVLPDVSPKSMNRRMSRSAVVFSLARAKYMGVVLPKVERAIRQLDQSLHELAEPIDVTIGRGEGQCVVKVKDYAQQAKTALALASLVDQQRSLLGFPSPGRRRNEGEDGSDARRVVDVSPAPKSHDLEGELDRLKQASNGLDGTTTGTTVVEQPAEKPANTASPD